MDSEIRKRLIIGSFVFLSTLLMLIFYLPAVRNPYNIDTDPLMLINFDQAKMINQNNVSITDNFLNNRHKLIGLRQTSNIDDWTTLISNTVEAINMLPGQKSDLVKIVLVYSEYDTDLITISEDYDKTFDTDIVMLHDADQKIQTTIEKYNRSLQKNNRRGQRDKTVGSEHIYLLDKSNYIVNHFRKDVEPLFLSGQLRNLF